jgi:hypothetical protein
MLLHPASAASYHDRRASSRPPFKRSAFSTSARITTFYDSAIHPTHHSAVKSTDLFYQYTTRASSEPITMSDFEDDHSCSDSERSVASGATTGGERMRKRSDKTSTSYAICLPAPRMQQLKHLRTKPEMLLQLQQISCETRPMPKLDVLVSNNIAHKFANKFPKMFKTAGHLGPKDIMMCRSADYATRSDSPMEDEAEEEADHEGECIAVFCQSQDSPNLTEIDYADGSIWYATPTAVRRGGFEFVSDLGNVGETVTARWVPLGKPRRSSDKPRRSRSGTGSPFEQRYGFSIMEKGLRRHPILAYMTRQSLDINDQYTTISTLARQDASKQEANDGEQTEEYDNFQRLNHAMSEDLRLLIQTTGLWVGLRLGWCPNFKADDFLPESCSFKNASARGGICGRLSTSPDESAIARNSRSQTPEPGHSSYQGRLFKSGSQIFCASPTPSWKFESDGSGSRNRAGSAGTSTGSAFMQRAAARKVTNNPVSIYTGDNESSSSRILVPASEANASPPGSPVLSRSSASTPETPTRPSHRRILSAVKISSPLQKGITSWDPDSPSTSTHDEDFANLEHYTTNEAEKSNGKSGNKLRKQKGGWRSSLASILGRGDLSKT